MCGIVGLVKSGKGNIAGMGKMVSDLLYVDTLRGQCGTGFAGLDYQNDLTLFKRALAGPDFLRSGTWEILERTMNQYKVVIGHNRAMTIGSVKDKNAHPFNYRGKYGSITLVHNGTLNGYTKLGPKDFSHEVDSAYACAEIAENGPEEAFRKIKGWYVFVWIDTTHNTFNIARNNNRDITWVYDTDGNMFYASEEFMLRYILNRHNHKLQQDEEGYIKLFEMPDNVWRSWDLSGDTRDLTKYEEHKIPPYEHSRPLQHGYYDGDHSEWLGTQNAPYKPDDKIDIIVESWEQYQRSNAGRLEGMTADQLMEAAIIHSLTKFDYDTYVVPLRDRLPVIVCSYRAYRGEDSVVCRLNHEKIKTLLNARAAGTPRIGTDPIQAAADARARLANMRAAGKTPPEESNAESATIEMVKGPEEVMIDSEEFKRLTKKGCAGCGDPVDITDAPRLIWNNTRDFLCSACQDIPDTYRIFAALEAVRRGAA